MNQRTCMKNLASFQRTVHKLSTGPFQSRVHIKNPRTKNPKHHNYKHEAYITLKPTKVMTHFHGYSTSSQSRDSGNVRNRTSISLVADEMTSRGSWSQQNLKEADVACKCWYKRYKAVQIWLRAYGKNSVVSLGVLTSKRTLLQ